LKRKAYYKKNNYNIIGCDIYNYNKDTTKWKVTYEPSNTSTPTTKKPSAEKEKKVDKTKTVNSRSSTEDTEEEEDEEDDEDDEEEEPKDKMSVGKCFLKFKK
jgi:hypothetical protein